MANFIGVDLYGQQTIDVQDTAARLELPNKADKDLYNVDPADVFSKIPMDTTIDSSATNSKLPTTKAAYDAIKAVSDDVTALDTDKAEKDLSNVDKDDVWTKANVSTNNINSSSSNNTIPTSRAVFDGVIENCINDYSFAIRGGKKINATSSNRADLNTYVTPGNFEPAYSGTTTTYIDNQPITVEADRKNFRLWVMFGEQGSLSVHQILIYDDENIFYIRTSNDEGSTWTAWINYANVQANWSQNDATADDYISNKPGTVSLNALINSSAGTAYLFTPAIMRQGIRVLSNPVDTAATTIVNAPDNGINNKTINRIYKEYTFSTPLASNATWMYDIIEAVNATYIYDMKVIGFTAGDEAVPLTINYMAIGSHTDSGAISFTNQYSAAISKVMIMVDYSL